MLEYHQKNYLLVECTRIFNTSDIKTEIITEIETYIESVDEVQDKT